MGILFFILVNIAAFSDFVLDFVLPVVVVTALLFVSAFPLGLSPLRKHILPLRLRPGTHFRLEHLRRNERSELALGSDA